MGRPKEFTDEQRADLEARGFTPVEIWVIDRNSDEYRQEVSRQMDAATDADRRDGEIDDWIVQVRGDLWNDLEP